MELLAGNILCLKQRMIESDKRNKKNDEESIRNIEFELARLEDPDNGGHDSPESKLYVMQLEAKKLKI